MDEIEANEAPPRSAVRLYLNNYYIDLLEQQMAISGESMEYVVEEALSDYFRPMTKGGIRILPPEQR